jgi:hypothetical protein
MASSSLRAFFGLQRDLEEKICRRALADLNPPGVPNSFRRRTPPRVNNIAHILKRRERGAASRIRAHGDERAEQYWAEAESAGKASPMEEIPGMRGNVEY